MPRIHALDVNDAPTESQSTLRGIEKSLGSVPNFFRTLAHSPQALNAYLGLGSTLDQSSLGKPLIEKIALTVANLNDCNYCTAAHATIAGMHGVSDDEIQQARQAEAPDAREAAILGFARAVVERKGWVDDATLQASRDAGVTDRELLETVAVVSQNVFSNYVNHLADTEVDFPAPQPAGTT